MPRRSLRPRSHPAGKTTADIVIDTLAQWGGRRVFGLPGDGCNGLMEALRKRRADVEFVGVRHEEAAAFAASGHAKLTGRLGVCLATSGPGAIHLLNGLYDAKMEGQPVVAVTGQTYSDLMGARYQQEVDVRALMADVAVHNVQVTSPAHAALATDMACRAAIGRRGVAHLSIPIDVQEAHHQDPGPMAVHDATAPGRIEWRTRPSQAQLEAAADLIGTMERPLLVVGQGCRGAAAEVDALARLMDAPFAKPLLGKDVLPDRHPHCLGGIGMLGTAPTVKAVAQCDGLVLLGTSFPYMQYLPKPGQCKVLQIDIHPERIGARAPVDLGLVGDVGETLRALLPRLQGLRRPGAPTPGDAHASRAPRDVSSGSAHVSSGSAHMAHGYPHVSHGPAPTPQGPEHVSHGPAALSRYADLSNPPAGTRKSKRQRRRGTASHHDGAWLAGLQQEVRQWWDLLDNRAGDDAMPMRPQAVAAALARGLAEDAIVACDTGNVTVWAARHIPMRARNRFLSCGTLASMGCALPYAVAAQKEYPDRQVVAFVGDGGFMMLPGELATAAHLQLPIKVVVLNNGTLGMIRWEQLVFLGNPSYGTDLPKVDFAALARAMGAAGERVEAPAELPGAIARLLATPGPALLECIVDANEPPWPPAMKAESALKFARALAKGEPDGPRLALTLFRDTIQDRAPARKRPAWVGRRKPAAVERSVR